MRLIKLAILLINMLFAIPAATLQLENGKSIYVGMSIAKLYKTVGQPSSRGVRKRQGKGYTQNLVYRIRGKYIDVLVRDDWVVEVEKREHKAPR